MTGKTFRHISAVAAGIALVTMATAPADARRGGSFGSRGARTASAPPPTAVAPSQVAPVQRTMTQRPAAATAQNPAAARAPMGAPRKSGGMLKGLLGGLVAGGLIAMLMGGGLGALAGSGLLTALLQVALIGGLAWLAFRLFRRRPMMAPAGAPGMGNGASFGASPFAGMQQPAGYGSAVQTPPYAGGDIDNLPISTADKEAFERLLGEVQDAFSREDYAALRACTTPEIMSYLAEELSQNATSGVRNDVSGTELLEAEVVEAWSEHDADYATIAMKYQSIDILRDRNSGAIVKGDPTQPTCATELWTFVRDSRNPWRLSAIQQA